MASSVELSQVASSTAGFDNRSRLSLLDVVKEKSRSVPTSKHNTVLHRLVYIGRINAFLSDRRELQTFFEKSIRSWQSKHQGEAVTGLLMALPDYVIHILESSQETLLTAIQDTMRSASKERLSHVRVVAWASAIPNRLYQQWSMRQLGSVKQESALPDDEDLSGELMEKLVPEVLQNLLQLSLHLVKVPKLDLVNAMEKIREKHPHYYPNQAQLDYLAKCPKLLTPEKYLEMFASRHEHTLTSELVWPAPSKFKPPG